MNRVGIPRLATATATAATVACSVLAAAPAAAKGGFYIGVGLGASVVSGERGVAVDPASQPNLDISQLTTSDDTVRTDLGQGLATLFRLGYNILGAAAIEMAIVGHGSGFDSSLEGAGHLCFDAVIHPLGIAELAGAVEESMWDPYVIIGGGFTYAGYTSAIDKEDKGWFGGTLQTGAGLNMHLVPFFSLGVDLRVTVPFYEKWYYNFDKDQTYQPVSTPATIIFTPQLLGTFHFG